MTDEPKSYPPLEQMRLLRELTAADGEIPNTIVGDPFAVGLVSGAAMAGAKKKQRKKMRKQFKRMLGKHPNPNFVPGMRVTNVGEQAQAARRIDHALTNALNNAASTYNRTGVRKLPLGAGLSVTLACEQAGPERWVSADFQDEELDSFDVVIAPEHLGPLVVALIGFFTEEQFRDLQKTGLIAREEPKPAPTPLSDSLLFVHPVSGRRFKFAPGDRVKLVGGAEHGIVTGHSWIEESGIPRYTVNFAPDYGHARFGLCEEELEHDKPEPAPEPEPQPTPLRRSPEFANPITGQHFAFAPGDRVKLVGKGYHAGAIGTVTGHYWMESSAVPRYHVHLAPDYVRARFDLFEDELELGEP